MCCSVEHVVCDDNGGYCLGTIRAQTMCRLWSLGSYGQAQSTVCDNDPRLEARVETYGRGGTNGSGSMRELVVDWRTEGNDQRSKGSVILLAYLKSPSRALSMR
uniref:Uncharacterized protein n=1 Tax=Ananas comosus var. bracteatus TaxID=296719 RepID=A0A6V7PEY9_ANACO|nr:unnamed protein product [Ananas comosus var. bracteatus]